MVLQLVETSNPNAIPNKNRQGRTITIYDNNRRRRDLNETSTIIVNLFTKLEGPFLYIYSTVTFDFFIAFSKCSHSRKKLPLPYVYYV